MKSGDSATDSQGTLGHELQLLPALYSLDNKTVVMISRSWSAPS